jgi:hypothetical protein
MGTQCTAGEHAINADGVTLCNECLTKLEKALKAVPDVWADIQVSGSRMDVGAPSVGSSGGHASSTPPANLDALDKAQTLRVRLGGWASLLPQLHPFGEPPVIAAWLLTQIPDIRKQPWAGDLLQELQESLQECRLTTDRAAERITLGQCWNEIEDGRCEATVTAVNGARVARCRACGATSDVRTRQQWLLSEAWEAAAPLPVILRALRIVGTEVKPKDAENWVSRGKVIACIHEDGAKTYQLNAMRRVHEQMQAKRERRVTREKLSSIA